VRYFAIVINPEGGAVPCMVRVRCESLPRSRGLEFQWRLFEHAAVLTAWDDNYGEPLVISDGASIAVGSVRLDNRKELERWAGRREENWTDLELLYQVVAQSGIKQIPKVLGDFAFVVWNHFTRTALAACDAVAVKKLYYAELDNLWAFASRAEALASEGHYEPQYLAELVAGCSPSPGLTTYAGVRSLPSGCIAVLERGRLTTHRYWSAYDIASELSSAQTEREAADMCRYLLAESVRLRLTGNADSWAQLSGGLDSSSVTGVAQWLVEQGAITQGLTGTITYVDRRDTASDEREYSSAVASRWHLRNETIVDPPLWYDDEYPPPYTDQPRMDYPFYPRERRLAAILRPAGGRVLLTGVGGDELFGGYMYFFADWVAHGRVLPAVREMLRRAAMGRVSFWALAYQNVLLPLLPGVLRNRLLYAGENVPEWVPTQIARRYALRARAFSAAIYSGRVGHKYHHAVPAMLMELAGVMQPDVTADTLDLRHPFLYRPLVEFALRLSPELCARPHQRKWVLREAMRDILPRSVQTRVGKGSPSERYAWSLTALRTLLDPLVRESVLAELGVVDGAKLRAAYDSVPQQPHDGNQRHVMVYTTLAIEAWLQVRSGRWPRAGQRRVPVAS
jgi:asparagine synthase (glutamine-hydrolysing)